MGLRNFTNSLRDKFNLPQSDESSGSSNMQSGEKTIVFVFSFIIALSLWMLINLGRDYSLTIQLPLTYGDFPSDQAPLQPLPDYTTATFTGEGWKLLGIYGNPPRITVNAMDASTNIESAIQAQLTTGQELSLNRADPSVVDIVMEESMTRTVPVENNIELQFRSQFGLIGSPSIRPDSVRVTGARSLVEGINAWPTRKTVFDDLNQPFMATVQLEESNELIRISHRAVNLDVEVAEFTEGEVRIPIEIEGGEGRPRIILTPATVNVRYNVPVSQFAAASGRNIIRAVISYTDIEEDTTGYIQPRFEIDDSEFDISIRTFTPRRASYFRLIEN